VTVAIVRPFRGLRPTPEHAIEVASPPYDVLTTDEARAMAQSNPSSFLRVNKAELEFDDGVDQYSEQVYRRGKDNLMRLYDSGIMIRDENPCFYLYRLTMAGKSQTGLAALASVDEYDQGKIKKHEHTRPNKVKDRANHISYLEAQVGPVLTTFKHSAEADAIFKRLTAEPAVVDFKADDGVRHEFWVVDKIDDIDAIQKAFAIIPAMYIADGHHRSASASEVCRRQREKNPNYTGDEPFNFFLTVTFPDSELNILPYNRVVKDLNGLTVTKFLDRVSDKFQVSKRNGEVAPQKPHLIGAYCEKHWYEFEAKPGSIDEASPTHSIDAAVLGDNLIGPILGITDPKTDDRIDFVGGIRGTKELVKLVDSGDYAIAFSLYPTSIQQLINVADAGEVMPPKSTWFEPKLRSGMVVSLLND
jgi:uncharacterized protein (DUF1015 family)